MLPEQAAKAAGEGAGQELALYGRGDHLDFDAVLTLHDRGRHMCSILEAVICFSLLVPMRGTWPK